MLNLVNISNSHTDQSRKVHIGLVADNERILQFHLPILLSNSSNVRLNLTFPQSPESLELEDLAVCLHCAIIASGNSLQVLLGLEADLHHICGLGKGHSHGPSRTTSQDTNANIGIWCWSSGKSGQGSKGKKRNKKVSYESAVTMDERI